MTSTLILSYAFLCYLMLFFTISSTFLRLKVGPDEAAFFLGTRDSVLMLGHATLIIVPRCPMVLQVLPTVSNSSQVFQLSQSRHCCWNNTLLFPTLVEALATPWDSVEQCSMGTLSLVPRSKVASSGPTLTHSICFSSNHNPVYEFQSMLLCFCHSLTQRCANKERLGTFTS